MAPEPLHDDLRLCPELPAEVLGLGIGGAAHGKILPHCDAVGVAEVKKCMVLIDVSAPAPDHVAAAFVQKGQGPGQPLPIPGMKGVQRHPVGPHDEHRLSVYVEPELPAAVSVGQSRALQPDRADAQPNLPAVDFLISMKQLHPNAVQIGLPHIFRPPQLRGIDVDFRLPLVVPQLFRRFKAVPAADAGYFQAILADFRNGIQPVVDPDLRMFAVRLHGIGVDFFDPALRRLPDIHIPP